MKIIVVAVAYGLMASMASANKAPAGYSEKESKNLEFCSMMADQATYAASYKLSGKTQEETLALYDNTSKLYPLQAAIVERTYAQTFDNAHSFAIGIFESCAIETVKIPRHRINDAVTCHLDTIVSSYALHMKRKNLSKQAAYEGTDSPDKERVKRIVDFVYNSNDDVVIKNAVWSQCMNPLIAK